MGKKRKGAASRTKEDIKQLYFDLTPKIRSKDTGLFITHFPENLAGLVRLSSLEWAHHPKGFLPCIEQYERRAWRTLVSAGFCAKKEAKAKSLPFPNFTELEKCPAAANAYVLLHLIERLRSVVKEKVAPLIGAIGHAWFSRLAEDLRITSIRKGASWPEPSARNIGKDLILEILGLALGVGELGQQLAVRQRESYAKGGRERLGALSRATKTSVEDRQTKGKQKKAMRARKMRMLVESEGLTRSKAALFLSKEYRSEGSYSSFYRSLDPRK